jgi:hypothetical protein
LARRRADEEATRVARVQRLVALRNGVRRAVASSHATVVPISIPSGTELAYVPHRSSNMGVLLSVVGLTLIAVGVIGSAVTLGREGGR